MCYAGNIAGLRLGRLQLTLAWAVLLAGLVPSSFAQDFAEVTVTGEGINADDAKKAALRKALEEGGKVEISSHSQVENFAMVRDTIYARAEGIITDYQILEQGPAAGGTFFCKIRAKVSKTAIATTWGEVQNVLDQIGRPGIMVVIQEIIDNVPDDVSILASKIKERLTESGFDVYNYEQLSEIQQKEAKEALLADNTEKLQAIAADLGAQIFIKGKAHADAAGMESPYGVALAMYNCDIAADMFYTDTAKLITSESEPAWRGGARGHHTLSRQAGKTALSNAGEQVVNELYEAAMKSWATQITAGGDVQLEVQGVDMKSALEIKKKLAAMTDVVKSVNGPNMTKGIAKYRIVATVNAESLVERLMEGEWEQLITVEDLKLNRIIAKKAGS